MFRCLIILSLGLSLLVWSLRTAPPVASSKHELTAAREAIQHRSKVHKEIWLSEEEQRQEIRCYADQSMLHFTFTGSKPEIREEMHGLLAAMQEEVTNTTQVIRYLDATDATYDYTTGRLQALEANISRIQATGNTIDTAHMEYPLFTGQAHQMELSLAGSDSPTFTAKSLTATLPEVKGEL